MSKDILYPLRRLHGAIYEMKLERKTVKKLQEKISIEDHIILFVLTPTHGNLGDHAIAEAIINLLKELDLNYIEITDKQLRLLKKYRRLKKLNGHPVIVNGGGNIGTLWPTAEDMFRKIILSAPDSKIICMPNTAYFENTEAGNKELKLSHKIYNQHSNLKICAREIISYELLENMECNVALIPDMVLSMNQCKEKVERKGCLLCLRKDIERTRTEAAENTILQQARQLFGDHMLESDMVIDKRILPEQRTTELEKKYDEFRHAELVITDRLHGMIFSAICGTPCIVLNSKSPKVKGCYEWIKHLGYIHFAENAESITEIYSKINKQNYCYDNSHLRDYYGELKKYILDLKN